MGAGGAICWADLTDATLKEEAVPAALASVQRIRQAFLAPRHALEALVVEQGVPGPTAAAGIFIIPGILAVGDGDSYACI